MDECACRRYVEGLSDDAVARWYALIVGQSFISRKCGDDLDCIASHSNAIARYVEDVWEDVKYFLDGLKNGRKLNEEDMDSTCRELSDIIGV